MGPLFPISAVLAAWPFTASSTCRLTSLLKKGPYNQKAVAAANPTNTAMIVFQP
jgi:hypothetical protein